MIVSLRDGDNVISGQSNLEKHITDFYKNLFGLPVESNILLDSRGVSVIDNETGIK